MRTTAQRALIVSGLSAAAVVLSLQLTPAEVAEMQPATAVQPLLLPEPFVRAEAALVFDARSGNVLMQKNATAQLPLASITKVMTVLVALEHVGLDESVVLSADSLAREGDSGLRADSAWPVRDLVDLALVSSSNDAAQVLADSAGARMVAWGALGTPTHAFVTRMNEKARELGLVHTYFLDPTGLDESNTMASAYGSAFDVARMLAFAVEKHPDIFAVTAHAEVVVGEGNNAREAHNTNAVSERLPGLLGGKTGFTDLAGGNLAVAFDLGLAHPVLVVVLGSTREGRFDDVERLFFFAREAVAAQ